jgi:hypothetical protein
VARIEGRRLDRLDLLGVVGYRAVGHRPLNRIAQDRPEAVVALGQRRVEQVLARARLRLAGARVRRGLGNARVEAVEGVELDGDVLAGLRDVVFPAEPPEYLLERQRRPVVGNRHDLAVQDRRGVERALDELHHLGQRVGDVLRVPGEDRDVLAVVVHLDPGAVVLPLDRGGSPVAERLAHAAGLCEHRVDGTTDFEAQVGQARCPRLAGDDGHLAVVVRHL